MQVLSKCDGRLENCGAFTAEQYITGHCPKCDDPDYRYDEMRQREVDDAREKDRKEGV